MSYLPAILASQPAFDPGSDWPPADRHPGLSLPPVEPADHPEPLRDLSYHRIGRALLESAMRIGRRERVEAAIELFRYALEVVSDDAALRNGLGASLVELARLEPYAAAIGALEEASECFELALETVTAQSAGAAAITRYQANLAMTYLMLGERLGDPDRIRKAKNMIEARLAAAAPGPWGVSVDLARMHDLLGNALMALGSPDAARASYQTAVDKWDDPVARARSLNNLGTAYAEEGRYHEARKAYADALALQPRAQYPLAWSRTQYNLGCLLFQQAEAEKNPQEADHLSLEALTTFESARDAHQYVPLSQDWTAITLGLANAYLGHGTRLYVKNAADHAEGIAKLQKAISLYKEAIPLLTPSQLETGLANVEIAFQIITRISTKSEMRGHATDVIFLIIKRYIENHEDNASDIVAELSFHLPLIGRIPDDMGKEAESVVSRILGVLASSDLPKAEWADILRTAIQRVSSPLVSGFASEAAHETAGRAQLKTSPKVEAVFGEVSGFRTKSHKRRDLPSDVVNDPEVINAAKMIVNGHRHTPISALSTGEAERLRAARAILRRHERKIVRQP